MDLGSPNAFCALAITDFASCAAAFPTKYARQIATRASRFNTASPPLGPRAPKTSWKWGIVLAPERVSCQIRDKSTKQSRTCRGSTPFGLAQRVLEIKAEVRRFGRRVQLHAIEVSGLSAKALHHGRRLADRISELFEKAI